jgi:hypothetical protein
VGERPEFRLAEIDVVAGFQIIGHLAFPARPQHGMATLREWLFRRKVERGEMAISEVPIELDKPQRLRARLATLDRQLRKRLRSGDWLNRGIIQGFARLPSASRSLSPGVHAGLLQWGQGRRAMARRHNRILQSRSPNQFVEQDEGHLIRDYWTQSLPVIHMAKASMMSLGRAYQKERRNRWLLERTVFHPDWVPWAIETSETTAEWAAKFGLIEHEKMIRFHR